MSEKQPTLLSEMHDLVEKLHDWAIMRRNIGEQDTADAYAQVASEILNRIAKTRKNKGGG